MNHTIKKSLFWTPRIAGILFVLFLGLFALDVFDLNLGIWNTLLALLIHLVPSILLGLAVTIAWKREWFGALLFIGWSVWYVASSRGFHWSVYVIIAGLPLVIGLFFLAGWIWRDQLRPNQQGIH